MPSHNSQQRDDRLVIGITGHIGAGKTSVGRYLESKYGFSYVRYSQVLSDWKVRSPESRAHLQSVGWEVMAGGMQQELNDRLIACITPSTDWVVDGLRHPIDFASLGKAFSTEFHLFFLQSSAKTRWKRISKRDPDRFVDFDAFHRADEAPVEQYIESLRGEAMMVVENEGSRDELYSRVTEVVGKMRLGGGA